jgi:hypothetical protein
LNDDQKERAEDVRDEREDLVDDRTDFREDVHDDREDLVDDRLDFREDRFDRYEDAVAWYRRRGIVVLPVGTVVGALPVGYRAMAVRGTSYYYHNHVFYARTLHAGHVGYAVTRPPVGAVVPALPPGHVSVAVGGKTYHHVGGTYYSKKGSQYTVVTKP